jgi:hypothetical protein
MVVVVIMVVIMVVICCNSNYSSIPSVAKPVDTFFWKYGLILGAFWVWVSIRTSKIWLDICFGIHYDSFLIVPAETLLKPSTGQGLCLRSCQKESSSGRAINMQTTILRHIHILCNLKPWLVGVGIP